MPCMDGFEVVRRIRQGDICADVPIIMVTALSSKEDRLKSVEAGANDFVAKPIDKYELKVRTESLLKMKEARDQVQRYQLHLEEMVKVRTQALELALENTISLQRGALAAQLETIHRLSAAAEFRDAETGQHIQRMSRISALLCRHLGLAQGEVDLVLHASPMHDVGKIGIPDAVLLKPGKLTPGEWEIMKQHASIGERILGGSDSELLLAGSIIAASHHEKWDGSGYPRGLAGEDIPLFGRICAVADVFDALTSARPYKPAFDLDKSLAILREGRGSHFDPRVLDAFLDNLDEALAIQEAYRD